MIIRHEAESHMVELLLQDAECGTCFSVSNQSRVNVGQDLFRHLVKKSIHKHSIRYRSREAHVIFCSVIWIDFFSLKPKGTVPRWLHGFP